MTNENVAEQLTALFQTLAAPHGAVVENVTLDQSSSPQVLAVTVDTATGLETLSSNQVADLARAFSKELDKVDPFEGKYMLEVGSPGAERQMLALRDYQRNVGRTVRVELKDSHKVRGTLHEVTESGFTLETSDGDRLIIFEDVQGAWPVAELPKEG